MTIYIGETVIDNLVIQVTGETRRACIDQLFGAHPDVELVITLPSGGDTGVLRHDRRNWESERYRATLWTGVVNR